MGRKFDVYLGFQLKITHANNMTITVFGTILTGYTAYMLNPVGHSMP